MFRTLFKFFYVNYKLYFTACSPSVHMNFDDYRFKDASGRGVSFGVENVIILNKEAYFAGDGMINMWRFSGADFRKSLAFSFSFMPSSSQLGDPIQAILSNCVASNLEESTLSINIIPASRTLAFKTVTDVGEQQYTVPYRVS